MSINRHICVFAATVLILASHLSPLRAQEKPGPEDYPQIDTPDMMLISMGVAATGQLYLTGRAWPKFMRGLYLVTGLLYILDQPSSEEKHLLHENSADFKRVDLGVGAFFLGLAAINDYYVKHPDRPKYECGLANVAGFWGMLGVAVLARSLLGSNEHALTIHTSPYLLRDRAGIMLQIRF